MEEIRSLISDAKERVHDHSLSLLSDALYRGDENAKKLERQSAKISRALEKALYEIDNLEKLSNAQD